MTSSFAGGHRFFVSVTFAIAVLCTTFNVWNTTTTTTSFDFHVPDDSPDASIQQKSSAEPKAGDYFVPGSLNMTRLEVNQKCYIDPYLYQHHLNFLHNRYVSKKQRLIYVQVRKSGSSNTKKHMDTYFNDTKLHRCKQGNMKYGEQYKDYFVFSMSREPVSRYVSGFQEVLHRWNLAPHRIGAQAVPEQFKSFTDQYLHKQMNHDKMLEALQAFVLQHDNGGKLVDVHLSLQSTELRPPDCPLKLDALYEVGDIDKVFDSFRAERKIEKVQKDNSKYSHSVNIINADMDSQVLRKICQLTALDYCCLNYELPPECEGVVKCRWVAPPLAESNNTGTEDLVLENNSFDTELMIEAVSPYPVRESNNTD